MVDPVLIIAILTFAFFVSVAINIRLVGSMNPFPFLLPFPDRGHRLFGVRDEQAREAVVHLLERVGGLKELTTFDSRPTHQTLMRDLTTVINWMDEGEFYPPTALSLPVENPLNAAREAVAFLRARGYTATLLPGIVAELPPNNLVMVQSDAFKGWVLVFRLPLHRMPRPNRR